MSSFYSIYVHVVFSTEDWKPVLEKSFRPELFSYLAGAVRATGCETIIVGGHIDHVHLLFRQAPTVAIPEMVKELKRSSGALIRKRLPQAKGFHWQVGYGAFSISNWDVEKIRAYIAGQEKHHEKMTGEEELRKLLAKHGVPFDERDIAG